MSTHKYYLTGNVFVERCTLYRYDPYLILSKWNLLNV
jgi:hypothetical protein